MRARLPQRAWWRPRFTSHPQEEIEGRRQKPMARVIEMPPRPLVYSIPLAQAVYCENCVTISNSRPDRCGVCGSEAVLRVEPVLNRDPDPPGRASFPIQLSRLRAVGA